MRVWVFRLILLAVLGTAGCHAASPPTHYYAAGSNWAIYLAWTEDTTGHLQGQVQVVAADPNDPAKMRSTNGAFTGTRNGDDISIAFPLVSNYLGATWTGTLKDNAISLVIPTTGLPANPTLSAGSFEDFQKAAQHVQSQVGVAQQQQAQQQAAAQQQQEAQQAVIAQQNQLNQQKASAYNGTQQAAAKVRDAYTEVRTALNNLATLVPESPGSNSLSKQYG
jgi:hypothetical protein